MNTLRTNANHLAASFKEEVGLLIGLATLVFFLTAGSTFLSNLSGWLTPLALFVWLFPVMLWLSFRVVAHADCLAVKLGEPYGTLILTLSVIAIEVVMISAVMLTGDTNPALGRDMMFAVLMIVLNGLIGASLLVGGLFHLEQEHNLQGANMFLVVLFPLASLNLLLPNYTVSTEPGTLSYMQMIFQVAASLALYVVFLALQTMRHQGFFVAAENTPHSDHGHEGLVIRSLPYHGLMLLANMLPIVLLSKSMAVLIDFQMAELKTPAALGGVLIALLVLAPEGLAAIRSARENHLQRSVNVCLGSALATIGMTVPAVLCIGLVTGNKIVLGLSQVDSLLLLTTLAVSVVTFSCTKTNVVHGVVHMILFFAYIVMIFD